MPRIQAIDPEEATGKTKSLFDNVQTRMGMVPNIVRTIGNSPAALEGYLNFNSALAGGVLPAKLREQIALTVSQINGCNYCIAAHCAIGQSLGLSEEELADGLRGSSPVSKIESALRFARQVVENRGGVSDDNVQALRNAGYSDEEIMEIIANIAINIFRNYANKVAGTTVDFPEVPQLAN